MNMISIFLIIFVCIPTVCHAVNATISKDQTIKDGASLISTDEKFELGFFSPENSTFRYVGIWYHQLPVQTVIWVANRDRPIPDESGVLTIGLSGNLMVLDGNGTQFWSSNVSIESNDTAARLMDTGNLILSSSESIDDVDKAYWQSFDNPTDTFLPYMKVVVDSKMGENRAFSSWKSASDPSKGNYTTGVDPIGSPEIVLWEGSETLWRSGPWNGLMFTGIPNMTSFYFKGFQLSKGDGNESSYFTYIPSDESDLLRFHVRWDGTDEQLRWDNDKQEWTVLQSFPGNYCESYNYCGDFGICNSNDSIKCKCMDGFEPKNQNKWSKGNHPDRCVRKTPLQCQKNVTQTGETGKQDGFKSVKCSKVPDFEELVSVSNSDSCKQTCLSNCSCNAYAFITGIGCMIWTTELVDVHHFNKGGSLFYLRLADSELDDKNLLSTTMIILIVVGSVVFLAIIVFLICRFKSKLRVLPRTSSNKHLNKTEIPIYDPHRSKDYSSDISGSTELILEGNQVDAPELSLFNFNCIVIATNNFSEECKLGHGGFGSVYKGKLVGGEVVAVKRLSKVSGQGLEEFKNEIILIAKLQHRNLVRLLGCCIHGEEKLLVYEYMPNKTWTIFFSTTDSKKQALLDWGKRFAIIEGIARGLLYLHRDSRLRIIHRDLKASNILLDEDMIPKISDFGMARIFGGNQNEANTNRVVGTYGYMSPEYAMEGLFSFKSDVYSFGVLLLEIVCGRRNTSFRLTDHASLVGYAWQMWNEGRGLELIDASIQGLSNRNEVLRCLHIGMVCVQDSPALRPSMAAVVLMLESETAAIPTPKQPTFSSMRANSGVVDICFDGLENVVSSNELTVTVIQGR